MNQNLTLFNKYYADNYEELRSYYPLFYRNVFEMNEILKAFGKLADKLEADIERTYLNNFVLTADAETIALWENILFVKYDEFLTLEYRRRVVASLISGHGHVGEPEIRNIISAYGKNAVSVDFENGVVKIVIEEEISGESSLLSTLKGRLPGHLPLNVTIHTLRTYRSDLIINNHAILRSRISALPPDVHKEFTDNTAFNFSAFENTKTFIKPEAVKRKETAETIKSEGVLYVTRNKYKIIE